MPDVELIEHKIPPPENKTGRPLNFNYNDVKLKIWLDYLEKLNENIAKHEEKITDIKLHRERIAVETENLQNEALENNIEILSRDAEELEDVNENKIKSVINRKSDEKKRLEPVNMRAIKKHGKIKERYDDLIEKHEIVVDERMSILECPSECAKEALPPKRSMNMISIFFFQAKSNPTQNFQYLLSDLLLLTKILSQQQAKRKICGTRWYRWKREGPSAGNFERKIREGWLSSGNSRLSSVLRYLFWSFSGKIFSRRIWRLGGN